MKNTISNPRNLFAAILLVLFVSCSKQDDVTPSTASKSDVNSTTAGRGMLVPEDAAIFVGQGSCLGNCPYYSVSINPLGGVTYTGYANVAVTGTIEYTISRDVVQRLVTQMENSGFYAFADFYTYMVDYSQQVTYLNNGEMSKRIVDYGVDIPAELSTMRQEVITTLGIDKLVNGVNNNTELSAEEATDQ